MLLPRGYSRLYLVACLRRAKMSFTMPRLRLLADIIAAMPLSLLSALRYHPASTPIMLAAVTSALSCRRSDTRAQLFMIAICLPSRYSITIFPADVVCTAGDCCRSIR